MTGNGGLSSRCSTAVMPGKVSAQRRTALASTAICRIPAARVREQSHFREFVGRRKGAEKGTQLIFDSFWAFPSSVAYARDAVAQQIA